MLIYYESWSYLQGKCVSAEEIVVKGLKCEKRLLSIESFCISESVHRKATCIVWLQEIMKL